ncbi:MAG: hydroxypyruvate isomerase family protein [Candidatus Velthaea sp.]
MPKFAANLTMMFNEVPFLDRFAAAAQAGFRAVEFLSPYEHPAAEVAARLHAAKLTQALFNTPPGNMAAGDRGMASIVGREEEFRGGAQRAVEYALALDCKLVHVMAGRADAGDPKAVACYIENVRHVADLMAPHGRRVVLEPINHRDIPGFFLNTTSQARELIERIDRPNVALQLDLYHAQITEGDLEHKIRDLAPITAHVQIAGNPARNEPSVGEVNYEYLFEVLDASGFSGWIGCEYKPAGGTVAGLGWAKKYLA